MAADLLNETLPGGEVWDAYRYVGFLTGGSVVVFTIVQLIHYHLQPGRWNPKRMATLVSFATFSLVVVVQDMSQLGQPVLWWRPWLVMLGMANALLAMYLPNGKRQHILQGLRRAAAGEDPDRVIEDLQDAGDL